jgi:rhodanese-related sulfurtransferase
MTTLIATLAVAATATLCDFTWYTVGIRHTLIAGVAYGALLLTVVGGALGAQCGRLVKGLPIGTLAGIGGALSYYILIAVVNSRVYGPAIPGAWITMWLLLAGFDGRWLRAPQRRSWREVAVRGVLAAFAGGLAFALVRNVLWGAAPGGRNYLIQFLAWAFAWTPGLMALTWSAKTANDTADASGGSAESMPRDSSESSITTSVTARELLARLDSGERPFILDVRSEREFAAGRVPGAVNIPFNQVSSRFAEVPGTQADELVLYCGHGPRAYMAATALRSAGRRRIVYLTGHFSGWERAKLRVED